jgi:L,D-peptidoglycan transpeptidase YkuD (ErfK/YbiS/YcfS/YnhG family)
MAEHHRRGLLVRTGHGLLALLLTAGLLSVASVSAPSAFADASPAPAGTSQLITVSAPSSASTAWQRGADGTWRAVIGPVAARVGATGIGRASEGSQHTPAGTFALTQAFGRQVDPGTRMPYFKTDALDWWDENPSSSTYNLHVRRSSSPGGASENLYYSGSVYDYVVNMNYNTARVPGAGSAFFLHVSDGTPTAGCVSVSRSVMVALLRWLDPARRPYISIKVGSPWLPYLPIGALDVVKAGTAGHIRVAGWAADRSSAGAADRVHVYVTGPSGRRGYAMSTSGARPDVLRVHRWAGGRTGYNISVPIQGHGVNEVCAYAISLRQPARHVTLGCTRIRV